MMFKHKLEVLEKPTTRSNTCQMLKLALYYNLWK